MKTALLVGLFCAVVWMIVAAICGGCAKLVYTIGAVTFVGSAWTVLFIQGAYRKKGMRG